MALARDAGRRTKIAVSSTRENVDPVGACVGAKGSRVQAVVTELRGEKIDIIPYDEDPAKLIANALSPAKVSKVMPHPLERGDDQDMLVIVPDDQLSLALGKEGQNARLASKLSGCKIDIKSESQAEEFSAKSLWLLPSRRRVNSGPRAQNSERMLRHTRSAQTSLRLVRSPTSDFSIKWQSKRKRPICALS